MALAQVVIDAINGRLETFGNDDTAFNTWMDTIAPHVRAHGDVGAFRTQARGFWLSGNKKGVRKLVQDTLSQPTIEERQALNSGEFAGEAFNHAYLMFLKRMGIHQGDTLSVHGADGKLHSLKFDHEGLPARAGARTMLTEPAPTPAANLEEDDE
jgi:hypothetical protein